LSVTNSPTSATASHIRGKDEVDEVDSKEVEEVDVIDEVDFFSR
jgi:hypothetical protein